MTEQLWIGMEEADDDTGYRVVSSADTREQVQDLMERESALRTEEGEDVLWVAVYDEAEDRAADEHVPLLNHIIRDREMRVDEETLMADRPPVAVVTFEDDVAIRFEYYSGHDSLHQEFDIRDEYESERDPSIGG